jgi:hypothetical protein
MPQSIAIALAILFWLLLMFGLGWGAYRVLRNSHKLLLLVLIIAVPISVSLGLYATSKWLSLTPQGGLSEASTGPGFDDLQRQAEEVQRQADSVPSQGSLFPQALPQQPGVLGANTAPGTTSTTPAALVRSQLIEVVPGLVVFNPPTEMTVGVLERITVRISRGVAEATVKANLQGRGVPQVEDVKVGTFMRARLFGNGFEVTSKSDENQVVPDNGFAEWVYDVTPLEAGTKTITLQISLRYKLPGSEETTNLPVKTRKILVQVNPDSPGAC